MDIVSVSDKLFVPDYYICGAKVEVTLSSNEKRLYPHYYFGEILHESLPPKEERGCRVLGFDISTFPSDGEIDDGIKITLEQFEAIQTMFVDFFHKHEICRNCY